MNTQYDTVVIQDKPLVYYPLSVARSGAQYKTTVVADNPALYYRLNDVTTTIADSSTSANNGVTFGTVSEVSPGAVVGGGAMLTDGATGRAASNGALPALTAYVSFEAWVYSAGAWAAGHEIFMNVRNTTAYLDVFGGKAFMSLPLNGVQQLIVGVTALTTGQWHHLVGLWDGSSMRLYVDGVQDAASAQSGPLGIASGVLDVGCYNNGGPQLYYGGRLAEVAVYTAALSATQVANHYAAGRVQMFYDLSGNNNNGTPTGMVTEDSSATPPTAAQGAALFDGATGYVQSGANLPASSTGVSYEAWCKITSNPSATADLVAGGGNKLQITSSGVPQFYSASANYTMAAAVPLSLSAWHHVVGTYDGTTVRLYVDGALAASHVVSALPSITATPAVLGSTGTTEWYAGEIAGAAVYASTLTSQQVVNHYKNLATYVFLPAPSGWQPWDVAAMYQVSYWDYETVNGVPAIVANSIATSLAGQKVWQKVWIAASTVSASA